jgi:uncharacterized protein YhdP
MQFVNFLRNSPLNKALGNLPDNLFIQGNGRVKISLHIPFFQPDHTIVKGTYQFYNNNLEFNYNIPKLININGLLGFSQNSVSANNLKGKIYNSYSNINITTINNGDMLFDINTNKLDYQKLSNQYAKILSPFIEGANNTEIKFVINKHGKLINLLANSNMHNIILKLPEPLAKESFLNKNFNFKLVQNSSLNINFDYESNLLNGKINISNSTINKLAINLGSSDNILNELDGKFNIKINTESMLFNQWYEFINKIISPVNTTDVLNNTHNYKKFVIQKPITSNQQDINNQQIESISVGIYTNNFFIKQYNLGNLYANMILNNNNLLINFNNRMVHGYLTYNITKRILNINIYNLIVKTIITSYNDESNKINLKYINQQLESVNLNTVAIYKLFRQQVKIVHNKSIIHPSINNMPNIKINIDNLITYGYLLGELKANIHSKNNDLILESGVLNNKYADIKFYGTSYCQKCSESDKLNTLNIYSNIHDVGKFLNLLNLHNIIEQGSGYINLSLQNRGSINNIGQNNIATIFQIKLKNGKLQKVDTGDLLGSILGILNLQSVVNLLKFNFSNIFSNGFIFNELNAGGYIIDKIMYIRYIFMSGTLAQMSVKGNIDLDTKNLDLIFSVSPHLGIGVAVTAGVLTGPIGIIVGIATYVGQLILGNPVNKLLTVSFTITGNLKQPNIKQIGVSNQISQNITNTITMD